MASLDATLLDDTAQRSARLVALGLLEDLAAERRRLTEARESETLHDFRVALRRLRSWLRAFGPALEGSVPDACARRLGRMARESNAGRDAEVFLGWLATAGPQLPSRERGAARWLTERFTRQEKEAESELEGRLAKDFDRTHARLEQRLSTYRVSAHVHAGVREPIFAVVVASLLRDHVNDLRRRLKRVKSVDDIDEAHRARITGKRLRYILEPVAPHLPNGTELLSRLRGLQDTLGDLHDAHVWLVVLRHVVADLAMEEGRRMAHELTAAGGEAKPKRRRGPPRAGLVSLARLAHERAEAAFARYQAEWADGTARAFHDDVIHVAERLEERAPEALEIERKFLLKGLPTSMPVSVVERMEQGYLPGDRLVERLRLVEVDRKKAHFRTIKVGSGLVRTEIEEETTAEVFQAMWPLTKGKRLTKRRHRVPHGELTWEIDEFTDRPLVLAEIELPSAETKVEIPEWLDPFVEREVTGDPLYLNWKLAR